MQLNEHNIKLKAISDISQIEFDIHNDEPNDKKIYQMIINNTKNKRGDINAKQKSHTRGHTVV